ncbi:hypothetical protein BD309DRAFT_664201 [Dichomitus squalens]|uniref:Uncharacterized protein n=1 Tax=Dichomitus squalens TaxID=114155 RepID=A0A4Q9PNN3_9APHY|nr:hypothetical protein BD309DRAFT_664201 [Dichomitus squalens]TBU55893.1 hypothetical protein BD310DRAFT_651984 [Dichomitus squalens]
MSARSHMSACPHPPSTPHALDKPGRGRGHRPLWMSKREPPSRAFPAHHRPPFIPPSPSQTATSPFATRLLAPTAAALASPISSPCRHPPRPARPGILSANQPSACDRISTKPRSCDIPRERANVHHPHTLLPVACQSGTAHDPRPPAYQSPRCPPLPSSCGRADNSIIALCHRRRRTRVQERRVRPDVSRSTPPLTGKHRPWPSRPGECDVAT